MSTIERSNATPLTVRVVRTAVANLASVLAGLRRAGAAPQLTDDPTEVSAAPAVVLPGVGAFRAGMEQLQRSDLVGALRQRVLDGRPLLAVCLGLQLLCESSEEDPGVVGLGVVPAQVTRFPSTVRVPQLGWNRVDPQPGCQMLQAGYAYFANSYRLVDAPEGWSCARAEYGGPFVAAVERGPILACQFHPELSGRWGLALIDRWLKTASAC